MCSGSHTDMMGHHGAIAMALRWKSGQFARSQHLLKKLFVAAPSSV